MSLHVPHRNLPESWRATSAQAPGAMKTIFMLALATAIFMLVLAAVVSSPAS